MPDQTHTGGGPSSTKKRRPDTCIGACDYLKEAGKIGAGGICVFLATPTGPVGQFAAGAACYYLYGKAADYMYESGDSFMY